MVVVIRGCGRRRRLVRRRCNDTYVAYSYIYFFIGHSMHITKPSYKKDGYT